MPSVAEVRRITRGCAKNQPPPMEEGERLLYINLTTNLMITVRRINNMMVLRFYTWIKDSRYGRDRGAWYPEDIHLQPVDLDGLTKSLVKLDTEIMDVWKDML